MKKGAYLLLSLAVTTPVAQHHIPAAEAHPFIAYTASAVPQGRSSISGFVFVNERQPLSDIYVELVNDMYSTVGRTKTTGSGRYTFNGLSNGNYKVKVLPYGTDFAEQTIDVTVAAISFDSRRSGVDNVQLDIYLKPRANTSPLAAPGTVFAQQVPEAAKKFYETGINQLREKKDKEAFESLKGALEIFPTYYLALDRLGTEYLQRGYHDAARILLTRAIEVNPRGFSSTAGLGWALYNLGHNEEAIENLQRATTLYDKSPYAYLWMGMALKKASKLERAEAAFKRAKETSNDKIAEVHWQMARLYSEQNRYTEAANALELFLKSQTDARDAEKIKQMIARLKEKAAKK
jgi:Tfp pilus assembly protein PilF